LLRRDQIGFIFQAFNLLPTLTAAENIELPIRIAGRKPDAVWVAAIVATLGLTDRLHHKQNYVGRILAAVFTCGVYTFFWLYNVMDDGNRHFAANWAWEDSLAQAVQQGQT